MAAQPEILPANSSEVKVALVNQTAPLQVIHVKVSILEKALEVSTLGTTSLIGASMNLIILYLYIIYPYTLSNAALFILNLIVTDLISCIVGIPIIIYGVLREEWPHEQVLCIICHAIISIPYIVSFWGHLGLAMCRFCLLKFKAKLSKILLQNRCVVMTILCMWVLSVSIHWALLWVPTPAASVLFLPDYGVCGVMPTSVDGYYVLSITLTTSMVLPLLLCVVLFITSTCEFKRQVNIFPSQSARKKFVQMSKYVTMLYGIFCLCWLPDYLRIVADVRDESPIWFKRLCFNLYYLNCAINPYVYALRCDAVRDAFKKHFPSLSTILGFNKHTQVATTGGEGGNQALAGTSWGMNTISNATEGTKKIVPRPAIIAVKTISAEVA